MLCAVLMVISCPALVPGELSDLFLPDVFASDQGFAGVGRLWHVLPWCAALW